MTAEEAQKNGSSAAAADDIVVDQPKPVTFAALKPRIYVDGNKASEAVAFFKAAFGAEEVERDASLKRKADQEAPPLLYAELKIGGASIIVADFVADLDACPVKAVSSGVFSLVTEDIDAAVEKAVKVGATSDGFTDEGGRVGKLKDPFGNTWLICTPAKPVPDTVEVAGSVAA